MFYAAIIGSDAAGTYENFRDKCVKFLYSRVKEGITILATEEHEYIKRFASECRLNVQYFFTDWKSYGKNALKERAKQLISSCSGLIYFNDGLKNTNMIVSLARKTGVPVRQAK
ncbi:MAG: hypothetical protein J6Y37_10295 [Paludibacteraceae bacterium]|nr:hypothetical protein [Paludibacteraceae bacterium]